MIEYQPVRASEYRNVGRLITGESRPFQLCLKCRCCAADDPKNCSSMPCCFGIDCDLPDKPYGVCAFTPKICNCDTCAV
ncbi:hypothetical protein QJS10_CPA07g01386 [Acorus calamus]|uniref:DUF7866 domain-containing protein n=1 Tax=Acorus calamus TaxID=4465 RepID=A0AAV9EGX7_ACOCL|nr:hypothetical protein QJS10_CPA07g01386 [Acorus calamus]